MAVQSLPKLSNSDPSQEVYAALEKASESLKDLPLIGKYLQTLIKKDSIKSEETVKQTSLIKQSASSLANSEKLLMSANETLKIVLKQYEKMAESDKQQLAQMKFSSIESSMEAIKKKLGLITATQGKKAGIGLASVVESLASGVGSMISFVLRHPLIAAGLATAVWSVLPDAVKDDVKHYVDKWTVEYLGITNMFLKLATAATIARDALLALGIFRLAGAVSSTFGGARTKRIGRMVQGLTLGAGAAAIGKEVVDYQEAIKRNEERMEEIRRGAVFEKEASAAERPPSVDVPTAPPPRGPSAPSPSGKAAPSVGTGPSVQPPSPTFRSESRPSISGMQAPATAAVSSSLVDYVIGFEGFHAKAYKDFKQYSIGYGTPARSPNEVIDKNEAYVRLAARLTEDKRFVMEFSQKYKYNWNNEQVDALTSFIYNLGKGALIKLTANGTRSNEEIAAKMLLYDTAGGKQLSGLTKRRQAESRKFKSAIGVSSVQSIPGNLAATDTDSRKIETGVKVSLLSTETAALEEQRNRRSMAPVIIDNRQELNVGLGVRNVNALG